MTAMIPSIRKEVQALAPMWVAIGVAIAAAPLWSAFHLDVVTLTAYVFGSVAVGAHVIGHEYAHRTLGSLLAQPVRRASILALKLGVLVVAVLSLTAVAWIGEYSPISRFPDGAALDSRVVFLPTLMGVTLAPYLALVARSTLGGAVFTIAVPGLFLISSDVFAVWWYGPGFAGEIDRFKYSVFPAATIAACAFAAIAIWRRFVRLEALGDDLGHVTVSLPGQAHAARSRTRRNAYWLLAAKELRLQQMTFVVVAIYMCGWAAGVWAQRSVETAQPIPWWQLNILYAALLSLLIGSLASAEERQLGTLEWQSLVPLSSWKQFAVKVAVVCGLVLVAGIGLPILLAQLMPLPHLGGFPRGAIWMVGVTAIAISIGSLYVSSLSSSGARAVATAFPVLAGAIVLARTVEFLMWRAARAGLIPRRGFSSWAPRTNADAEWAMTFIAAGVVAVYLVLAYRNHAAIDRGMRRVSAQAVAIAGVLAAAGVAMFVLGLR
jgi:hypothetical protein